MRHIKLWVSIIGLALLAGSPASGQGNKGKGGGGGETEDNSGHAPMNITLRDCRDGYPSATFADLHPETTLNEICAGVADDRVQSDSGLTYENGVDGVEAYVGTKGTAGNIHLKLGQSPRTLVLDFADCASPPSQCSAPFAVAEIGKAHIYVEVSAVRKNGAFALAIGETVAAPAQIYYAREGDSGPGRAYFNPNLSGKNPCKNRLSNLVNVTRTGESTWDVLADANALACVTLPDNGEFAGMYRMPFRFTAEMK